VQRPVYLFIDNGKPELRDAADLWGKDCLETEDILKNTHGKDTSVACIGPSGEKLSLIAAIMNEKGRAAGRSSFPRMLLLSNSLARLWSCIIITNERTPSENVRQKLPRIS